MQQHSSSPSLGLLGLLESRTNVTTAMSITMSSLPCWTVASNREPLETNPSLSALLSGILLQS